MRFFSLLLIIACGARAQEAWPMGRHALAMECPGGELPFGLILDAAGGACAAGSRTALSVSRSRA